MSNKKVIIVEGCDRTGKSTFISILEEKLKLLNKFPLTFHILGPDKFPNLNFNNDEKSLIQLAKYNDEYKRFSEILSQNNNTILILDRSSFSEFVWAKYWNREGKYSNYINEKEFWNSHINFFNRAIYIDYRISNVNLLSSRIKESNEDTYIFTQRNKSIEENILDVYNLYDQLKEKIVKDLNNMQYIYYDNIHSLEKVNIFANNIINQYFKEKELKYDYSK